MFVCMHVGISVCDMTYASVWRDICGYSRLFCGYIRLFGGFTHEHFCDVCDMTHASTWRNSCICVTWLISRYDVVRYLENDGWKHIFIWIYILIYIYICHVYVYIHTYMHRHTHIYIYTMSTNTLKSARHDVDWYVGVASMWHDSFLCVWHDSLADIMSTDPPWTAGGNIYLYVYTYIYIYHVNTCIHIYMHTHTCIHVYTTSTDALASHVCDMTHL